MLTAIAGRRWVIEHGLRIAIIKCAESTELRQAFIDVMSAGISKGMSEGLKHGVEHGRAMKYPLVNQLEKLKDVPIDVIMSSLFLESDSGEDTSQWIRELCPSSSQLKIPVYLEVQNPRDLWTFKEKILLEDAIAANISSAKNKKKCRVVCHTHGVSFVHHARSDGVPKSVPTVTPQGLAILLADALTQTDVIEDEESSRLLRSKPLSPLYNLN
nr:transposase (putative), gypsy type [Tanacetum cinerariifolium]